MPTEARTPATRSDGPLFFCPDTMAIVLSIEVSDAGLHGARVEIQEFLSHASTRSEATAHLSYVVLSKLLRETDKVLRVQAKEEAEREAARPKPTIRELRKVA